MKNTQCAMFVIPLFLLLLAAVQCGWAQGYPPAEFSEYIKADIVKWAKVVKAIGAQVD